MIQNNGRWFISEDAIQRHTASREWLTAMVNDTPVIVVGRDWTGDRQRFTLAHELGYLALAGCFG